MQRSTPIAAMEVILNLRPIEIEAETKAILTAGRLRRNGDWRLKDRDKKQCTARFLEDRINDKFPFMDLPTVHGKKTFCYTFFNTRIDPDAQGN